VTACSVGRILVTLRFLRTSEGQSRWRYPLLYSCKQMRFWSLMPWPGWNFKWIYGNTVCNNVGVKEVCPLEPFRARTGRTTGWCAGLNYIPSTVRRREVILLLQGEVSTGPFARRNFVYCAKDWCSKTLACHVRPHNIFLEVMDW
jgi:hypothetical protein